MGKEATWREDLRQCWGSLLIEQKVEDKGEILGTGSDLPFDLPGEDWTLVQPQSPGVHRGSGSYVKPEICHTSPHVIIS